MSHQPSSRWNPRKHKCKECGTEIWSKYPGEYCECKCTENPIAVDQTEHYSRFIGNFDKFESIKK